MLIFVCWLLSSDPQTHDIYALYDQPNNDINKVSKRDGSNAVRCLM
jgi:hypothetical protein